MFAWHRRHAAAAALGPLSELVSVSRPASGGVGALSLQRDERRDEGGGPARAMGACGASLAAAAQQRCSALLAVAAKTGEWRRKRHALAAPCMLAATAPAGEARGGGGDATSGAAQRRRRIQPQWRRGGAGAC